MKLSSSPSSSTSIKNSASNLKKKKVYILYITIIGMLCCFQYFFDTNKYLSTLVATTSSATETTFNIPNINNNNNDDNKNDDDSDREKEEFYKWMWNQSMNDITTLKCPTFDSNKDETTINLNQHIYDEITDRIIKNQFKNNENECNPNENYWISNMRYSSGWGYTMRTLAMELLTAVSLNKTFVYGYHPTIVGNQWPFYNQRNAKLGMDYYFLPITNCKLPAEEENNNNNGTTTSLLLHELLKLNNPNAPFIPIGFNNENTIQYWSKILPNLKKEISDFGLTTSMTPSIQNYDGSPSEISALISICIHFLFFRGYNPQTTNNIIANNMKSLYDDLLLDSSNQEESNNKKQKQKQQVDYNTTTITDMNMIIDNESSTIAVPIRWSDVCHSPFNATIQQKRQMLNVDDRICPNVKQYMDIIQLTQTLYYQDDDDKILNVIVTSEDSSIIQDIIEFSKNNASNKVGNNDNNNKINIVLNRNDVKAGSGNPSDWTKKKKKQKSQKMTSNNEDDKNDLMTSMLTTIHYNLLPSTIMLNLNSNSHAILKLFHYYWGSTTTTNRREIMIETFGQTKPKIGTNEIRILFPNPPINIRIRGDIDNHPPTAAPVVVGNDNGDDGGTSSSSSLYSNNHDYHKQVARKHLDEVCEQWYFQRGKNIICVLTVVEQQQQPNLVIHAGLSSASDDPK